MIIETLRESGVDVDDLGPDDLAQVDEFHVRGREATDELAELAGIEADTKVLDVGSGIGGPARRLAAERGARVIGIDLTREYCEAAAMLTERTGLADKVEFRRADALELPFEDESFDVVWTQHTAMNIADRPRLYSEMARVLRPGGRLAAYDVVQRPGGDVHFPVPWASSPEASFLVTSDELVGLIEDAGPRVVESRDVTAAGLEWVKERAAAAAAGKPALGPQILFGDRAKEVFGNVGRSMAEGRVGLHQIVAER